MAIRQAPQTTEGGSCKVSGAEELRKKMQEEKNFKIWARRGAEMESWKGRGGGQQVRRVIRGKSAQ